MNLCNEVPFRFDEVGLTLFVRRLFFAIEIAEDAKCFERTVEGKLTVTLVSNWFFFTVIIISNIW